MKTNRIVSALRKCKAALELHHILSRQHFAYDGSIECRETLAALQEAENVLADWQIEKLKKSEAFQ